MTRITDHQTKAALAEPWPFPQPVQFAGVEPADHCAECMQLRAELAAAHQQIDHLNRLALRSRSTAAGR
jgi:hypothetical protein